MGTWHSSNLSTSNPQGLLDHRNYLEREMKGRWLGTMPVGKFLDEYFPVVKDPLPRFPDNPFEDVPKNKRKSKVIESFITTIKAWTPHLDIVNTSTKSVTVGKFNIKTDIAIYDRVKGVAPPDKTDFTRMELWVAFNSTNEDAPFQDPPSGDEEERLRFIKEGLFTPDTEEAANERGRLVHYAELQHGQQVRHASYSIVIRGDEARFLRWDPSATIVTASFNYRKKPRLMAEFLWRFDHHPLRWRGHDTSIKPALLEAEVDARIRKKLRIKEDIPLYQYKVPGLIEVGNAYGPMLPKQNPSLIVRCTRSSPMVWIPRKDVADGTRPLRDVSWTKEKMIYLKDTWRYRDLAEHEAYEMLHRHETPNIPKHVAGGDVEDGGTEGEWWSDASWLCVRPKVSYCIHYRLVHGIVGRPVSKFKCTKELVTAILDALEAHAHAVKFAKLLHRDISAGNIILTDEGRGLLIDWELAKEIGENATQRPGRTGTWAFISVNLLGVDDDQVHTVVDDLESFLHVLAWLMLNFVPAVQPYEFFRKIDMHVFDEVHHIGSPSSEFGGEQKRTRLVRGEYPSLYYEPRCRTPLFELLKDLRRPFKARYTDPPSDKEREVMRAITDFAVPMVLSRHREIKEYDKNMKRLESAAWFIETMRDALEKETWPTDDKSDTLSVPFSASETTCLGENKTGRIQSVGKASKRLTGKLKREASMATEPSAKRRRVG